MGIPTNCKRLVEVDFPLVEVSKFAAKEKTIATGSIGSIHKWFARRPLASCRAMNLACLLPDPADENCPTELRRTIAKTLDKFEKSFDVRKLNLTKIGCLSVSRNSPIALRNRLLNFIAIQSNYHSRASPEIIRCSKELLHGIFTNPPVVLDPFSGGGSIPLEALRVGAKVIATDLNPIPVELNKLQLSLLPNSSSNFEAKVLSEANKIQSVLESFFQPLYPITDRNWEPIGYICARTITCEGSGCGLQYPLLSSPWVSKTKTNRVCYSFRKGDTNEVVVEIINNPKTTEIPEKTIHRGHAKCPICNHTTPNQSVTNQLARKRGGAADSRMLVVIGKPKIGKGRVYSLPGKQDIDARVSAANILSKIRKDSKYRSLIPTESLPDKSLGFSVQRYGIKCWSDLYSPRQLLTQVMVSEEVNKIQDPLVKTILSLVVSKWADRNCSLAGWDSKNGYFKDTFALQTINITWDFVEIVPFSRQGGPNWLLRVKDTMRGVSSAKLGIDSGDISVLQADASEHPLGDSTLDGYFTDPPYYDKVPYSNLSNFFLVWLKRILTIENLENGLAPVGNEIIKDAKSTDSEENIKSSQWYENMMQKAFSEGRRMIRSDGIGYVVFADKSTEGWGTAIKGLVNSGWMITASWPITTELDRRMRGQRSASLTTSVHIVIRPRPKNSAVGEWSTVLTNLPKTINLWLARMTADGIMGADAIYSCIGPAMKLFSKYDSVERASGEEVSIDEYLQYVWDTVSDEAIKLLSSESEQSTAEADARFSMMVIWTLRQSTNEKYSSKESTDEGDIEVATEPSRFTIPFDTASLLARGIGAVIDDLEKSEVIEVKGGIVKILSPEDRRHYLLGVTNNTSIVQQKPSGGIQVKLGESWEEAEARIDNATKQKDLIEMPNRDSKLDKLHQAMLLHGDGNSVALETHIRDNIGDDPAVWQLAITLNTLYPEGSWERNKVEGVIARYQSLR